MSPSIAAAATLKSFRENERCWSSHRDDQPSILSLCPSMNQEFQSWKNLKNSLYMLNNFCFHVYAQKSLSHSFTLSFTLPRHAEQLLFSCLCSKLTLPHSHSSLSHSLSISFTHSQHAEQLLFSSLCSKVTVYRRKLQCFFWTSAGPSPVSLDVIELVPS